MSALLLSFGLMLAVGGALICLAIKLRVLDEIDSGKPDRLH